jgi:hypothetical protein
MRRTSFDVETAGGLGLADAWKKQHQSETNHYSINDSVVDLVSNTVVHWTSAEPEE